MLAVTIYSKYIISEASVSTEKGREHFSPQIRYQFIFAAEKKSTVIKIFIAVFADATGQ